MLHEVDGSHVRQLILDSFETSIRLFVDLTVKSFHFWVERQKVSWTAATVIFPMQSIHVECSLSEKKRISIQTIAVQCARIVVDNDIRSC
jgi:hypothetical protein